MTSFQCIFEEQLLYFSFILFCVDILNPNVDNEIQVNISCGQVSFEANVQLCKLHFKYSPLLGTTFSFQMFQKFDQLNE